MNLYKLTKKELLDLATKKKIKGANTLLKDDLISLLTPYYTKNVNSAKESITSSDNIGYVEINQQPVLKPKPDEYPIPDYYNIDMIILLPVDPSKEYVYWELSESKMYEIKQQHNISSDNLILKMYMKSDNNVVEAASVSVPRLGNWFFNIYAPEKELWSELGFIDANGNFFSILKSNIVKMPANQISTVIDDETWMTIGKDLDKLYELSGLGKTDIGSSRTLQQTLIKQLASHISSSNFIKGS